MITKQDVIDEIDREIISVDKRGWVKRHWPQHAHSDPKQKILDDLSKQKKAIQGKDEKYFEDFDDIHDALETIENEIYGVGR